MRISQRGEQDQHDPEFYATVHVFLLTSHMIMTHKIKKEKERVGEQAKAHSPTLMGLLVEQTQGKAQG
jgi:hypothetical protein